MSSLSLYDLNNNKATKRWHLLIAAHHILEYLKQLTQIKFILVQIKLMYTIVMVREYYKLQGASGATVNITRIFK